MENQQRLKQAQIGAIVGIVGNVILAAIKAIVGFLGNSTALIADAVHSASDVVGSLAVLFGIRAANRPPDEDHPYGHGKAEPISAIIVAVLLAIVGFEIAMSSIEAFKGEVEIPKFIALLTVIFSIFIKEAMFRYKYNLGKRINSAAIIANAYEHRSDVFSSLAALVGIGAAMLGGRFGIPWLVYADPVAGLFVSLLVIKMAWSIGKEAIHSTLDHVLHEEDIAPMYQIVSGVEGVKKVDALYAREHGHYVIVDIKVSVDPHITVEEGHRIGKRVKEALMTQANVQNVFVHINPYSSEE
ncbi:cation diffusion facilitator family transporter [Ectobacillus antri]|uniref:Cation diffusion facilitator family transporter n=1 Tax=Ectobacillus antri TaxID=2486280 RepID=A0ABT6H2E7_9BACI|nr:cation diffusion facilitator family transporter [Ectobacillus antri]MDG4655402.1 cation diffusion facilitator family transporter [Ectobacillus antri]MDG5753160.1 cation diffusion facilitator family transporter [Ectobacillus antri]